MECDMGNEIRIRGYFRSYWLDGTGQGRVFLRANLDCSNGLRWAIDCSEDSPFHALDAREVIVSGQPCETQDMFVAGKVPDRFRASSMQIAEISADAQVVELEAKQELTGHFEQSRAQPAEHPLTFVTLDGKVYRVVNDEDREVLENAVANIRAYPVRSSPPVQETVPRLWIVDVIDTYLGEWRDGRRNGQGTRIWSTGGKYVGGWLNDREHGHGILTYPDGEKYDGEWRDGKKHGQGSHWRNGTTYVGEWQEDKEHGQGRYTWPDGDVYVGEWRGGLMAGWGMLTKRNGERYVGQWRDCRRHGEGICVNADGTRQEGIWQEGTFVREGSVTLPKFLLKEISGERMD